MTSALRDNDTLLIVGSSPERWDDVEKFWELGIPHDVCCINKTGIIYPCPFKHWFSYHSTELVEQWSPLNPGAMLHTSGSPMDGVRRWRLHNTRGSSSLMATRCALQFWGYDRVILAGVSLSEGYADKFLPHWRQAIGELDGKVKSMSGHTAKLLGYPEKYNSTKGATRG